jgi:predicted transcriptional regulator
MERRNSFEITSEILMLAKKGAKKSHIVYGANLNHAFLDNYLTQLEEQGLITRSKKKVVTTKKGLMFAQQYENLLQLQNNNVT